MWSHNTTSWRQQWSKHSALSEFSLRIPVPRMLSLSGMFLVSMLILATLVRSIPVASARSAQPEHQQISSVPAQQAAASTNWYFAEGSIGGNFQEYLALFNPNSTSASVTITYLFSSRSPREFTRIVNPRSRFTVNVNVDLGVPPNGAHQDISAIVRSSLPIVAERPMYFTFQGIPGGTDVLGATNTNSSTFYFAEGDASPGYATFVTILNPSSTETAHILIRYYSGGSRVGYQNLDVGPLRRGTASPNSIGLSQRVAIQLISSIGLVVERPLYFRANIPTVGGTTTGAASVVGASRPGSDWLFAEGFTGFNFQEYLVVANFTYADTTANVKLLYTNGSTQTIPITVKSLSQTLFDVNAAFAHPVPGSSPTTSVSAEVTASTPSIVAERLMYFRFGSQQIPGGTDVVGEMGPASHSLYTFAEGYISPSFFEFLTIQNPTNNAETASITLFVNNTTKQITQPLLPHSRATVGINSTILGTTTAEVSMSVEARGGIIVAERPLYFNKGGSTGGTNVIGFTGDLTLSPCAPVVQPVSSNEIIIGNTSKPQVALTFDAGGEVAPAGTILSILKNRGVHATWMFTAEWAQQNPTIVTGVSRAGFEIGNHTATHPDLTTLSDTEICKQLNHADQVVSSMTGHTTRPYMRPPYGARDQRVRNVAANLGYRTVIWTIDTLDWQTDSTPERILQIITSKLTYGAIILMHAGSASEAQALDRVITFLQGKGYQLVTLSEILQGT